MVVAGGLCVNDKAPQPQCGSAMTEPRREGRPRAYEGRLWAAVRLPNIKSQPSFVFQLPPPIRGMLADREFSASSESGIPAGRIRITEDGRSWGYGPFLSRSGADESDILIVEFDLADHTALLRLGDDEVLEKLNP
jgi:hypothetical protein